MDFGAMNDEGGRAPSMHRHPAGLTTLLRLRVVAPLVAVRSRGLVGTVETSHLSALVPRPDQMGERSEPGMAAVG